MSLITVGISVNGKVQGVFFRKYTCDAAKKYSVTGYVRNEPDGSVYTEVTGTSEHVKKFIQWCHEGSPQSEVEKVEVIDKPLTEYTGFRIRY